MATIGRPKIVGRTEKYCARCDETKPLSEFYGGCTGYCKECEKHYKRERLAINKSLALKTPEQIAEDKRLFQIADAERIRNAIKGKPGFKICNTCNIEKPHEDFYKSARARDGRQGKCIQCERQYALDNKEYRAAYATNYERENKADIDEKRAARIAADPEKHKKAITNRTLKYLYGITLDERDAMIAAQGGGCAICGILESESEKRFCVDHCHDTGEVRGILCINCNTGIGNLKDSLALLKLAVSYLEGHQQIV